MLLVNSATPFGAQYYGKVRPARFFRQRADSSAQRDVTIDSRNVDTLGIVVRCPEQTVLDAALNQSCSHLWPLDNGVGLMRSRGSTRTVGRYWRRAACWNAQLTSAGPRFLRPFCTVTSMQPSGRETMVFRALTTAFAISVSL